MIFKAQADRRGRNLNFSNLLMYLENSMYCHIGGEWIGSGRSLAGECEGCPPSGVGRGAGLPVAPIRAESVTVDGPIVVAEASFLVEVIEQVRVVAVDAGVQDGNDNAFAAIAQGVALIRANLGDTGAQRAGAAGIEVDLQHVGVVGEPAEGSFGAHGASQP